MAVSLRKVEHKNSHSASEVARKQCFNLRARFAVREIERLRAHELEIREKLRDALRSAVSVRVEHSEDHIEE